eukprot:CAMPEP_0117444358 /NCGR_PEP_ID=MMETSP0759-20121206/5200_1 /TAXON_ID=63605 /ORGANISM="Percolomonas cosmopolitus, Strain WS" /LENGTH=184 /DNA_ID=CAMNT_0005236423 /DNA_START=657 /DNA_END=1211 /DNA_ORIENTATION=-
MPANPAVVYGALFVVYLMLSFGMTFSFLTYGGMLAYKIKTSPLSKSSDIKKLTILTSVAVAVHFLYIMFMILGVLGLLSTVNDSLENATKHVWPFFYLLGYAVIVVSTTILLCFFGRDTPDKNAKKKRKLSKRSSLTEEEKLEKKMQDMELKEQRKRIKTDRIDSLVTGSPVDDEFENVNLDHV